MFDENKSINEIINIAEANIFKRTLGSNEKLLIEMIIIFIKNGEL